MDIDSVQHSPAVKSSAVKWGLVHVAISVVLALISLFVLKTVGQEGGAGTVLLVITSVLMPVVGFVISGVLMFLGISKVKNESSPPHLKFVTTLKWVAIFLAVYVVLYGIFNIGLSAYTVNSMDMSEMPEEASELMSSPLMVIVPTIISVGISSFVLAAIGVVIGLILKTD